MEINGTLYARSEIDDASAAQTIKPLPDLDSAYVPQSVSAKRFAAILNTSKSSVQKWEIGQKRPTGTALKLLHLVQKNGLEAVS